MGIFSVQESTEDVNLKDVSALSEAFIFDELSRLPDTDKKAFIESAEAQEMVNEGIITKRTLVRLSKKDDIERRETMAAFQLAKEADDSLWTQLAKNRVKERELIAKIKAKYGSRSKKAALIGQKAYLKSNKGLGKMFAKITGH